MIIKIKIKVNISKRVNQNNLANKQKDNIQKKINKFLMKISFKKKRKIMIMMIGMRLANKNREKEETIKEKNEKYSSLKLN